MSRTFNLFLLVASATWFAPGARAEDTESARRCAEVDDDAQRLACYDQLFRSTARTAPAKQPSAAPATNSAWAVLGANEVRDFGLSEADKRRNVNLPTAPESISVKISSVTRRLTGEQVFTTEDGQAWAELEPSSRSLVKPGETVTIRKAALGSYVLVTATRAGFKVKRLN